VYNITTLTQVLIGYVGPRFKKVPVTNNIPHVVRKAKIYHYLVSKTTKYQSLHALVFIQGQKCSIGLSTRYLVFEEVAPGPNITHSLEEKSLIHSKSISSGGEYVTLQKYFSHPSLDIFTFLTPS